MDGEYVRHVEEMVVLAASLALGVILLIVDDHRLPKGKVWDWFRRMGSGRRWLGLLFVLSSVVLLLLSLAQ